MDKSIEDIYQAGTAANTTKAHRSDLKYFWAWVAAATNRDQQAYPVDDSLIIQFITDHLNGLPAEVEKALVRSRRKRPGRHSIKTISRRISTLSFEHQENHVRNPISENPDIKNLLRKARKMVSAAGYRPNKKRPITMKLLEQMAETKSFYGTIFDLRDKAILYFAFSSGGRRRSEVAAALIEDLEPIRGGFIYWIPRSKTDQEGKGRPVPLRGPAASALRAWLTTSGIESGPIFRQILNGEVSEKPIRGRMVADIIKQRVEMGGRDPKDYAGHSIRRGFATEAGRRKKPLGDVMALGGWKTPGIVMGYYEAGGVMENSAGDLLGESR